MVSTWLPQWDTPSINQHMMTTCEQMTNISYESGLVLDLLNPLQTVSITEANFTRTTNDPKSLVLKRKAKKDHVFY